MLTEDNKVHILRLFFEGPNVRLHLREVARRAGLSATGAMKILGALEKEGLLAKNECGNKTEWAFSEKGESLKRFILS